MLESFKKSRLLADQPFKSVGFWFDALLLAALIVTAVFVFIVWGWECTWIWLKDGDSNGEAIRNVGLVIGGVIAMRLAIWRSRVAERQTDIAQRGLLNERYQKGAEMLGHEQLTVRLGGIYALDQLAVEYPAEYHSQSMGLFSAFVRNPTVDPNSKDTFRVYHSAADWDYSDFDLRPDVQVVMEAIVRRSSRAITRETERDAILQSDFRGADLRELVLESSEIAYISFLSADLSRASFSWAFFHRVSFTNCDMSPSRFAHSFLQQVDWDNCRMENSDFNGTIFFESDESTGFVECNLTGADFSGANLTGIRFLRTDLRDVQFDNANLTGVRFSIDGDSIVRNLTQSQIDVACADPINPPILDGVIDPQNGKQLVWRGKSA